MAERIVKGTAVIGLGGTGANTILYLKKTLMEQFEGKIPPAIQFLCMDTDNATKDMSVDSLILNKKITIEDDEFLHLEVRNPLETIRSSRIVQEWWPKNLPAMSVRNGTGALRALGRLAFYANSHVIMKIIRDVKLARIDGRLLEKDLKNLNFKFVETKEIYIIGSLAGGTGSGCFLETAFLVNCLSPDSTVWGFFTLPWIFEGLPATPRLGANTYAALKELEFYMKWFDSGKNSFMRRYGLDEIEVKGPPFNIVILIDGRNEKEKKIEEKGSSGVKVLCELAAKAIVATCGPMGKIADSITNNIKTVLTQETEANWGGKKPYYSSIGASTILYPATKHFRRLSLFYSLMLIDKGIEKYRGFEKTETDRLIEKAIENDVETFLTEVKLKEENDYIIDRLIPEDSCSAEFPIPEDIPRKEIVDRLKALTDTCRKELKECIESEINKNSASLIEKALNDINEKLENVRNRQGLGYAINFSRHLVAKIQGYKDSLRVPEIENHKKEIDRLLDEQKRALLNIPKAFKITDRLLGKDKEIIRKYKGLVEEELYHQRDAARKERALYVYGELTGKLEKFIEDVTSSLPKVLRKLETIKAMIKKDIEGLKSVLFHKEHQYDVQVPSFGKIAYVKKPGFSDIEVHDVVDFGEILKEKGIEPEWDKFLRDSGLTNKEINAVRDEELLQKISEYSKKKVDFINDITVEDVLMEEMDRRNDKDYIKKKVKEASELAAPYWFHRARTTDMGMRMQNLFIIGTHKEKTILKNEVSFLTYKSQSPDFAVTNDPHRIYFYKYTVPLAAYLLVDMEKYKKEYIECPVKMTPHIEKDLHLLCDDLFPETIGEQYFLRLFSLAYCMGDIVMKTKSTGEKIVTIDNKMYGKSFYEAFSNFKDEQSLKLRENMKELVIEKIKKEQEKSYKLISECIENLNEKLKLDGSMPIGESITLYKIRAVLEDFQRHVEGGKDIETFLE